MSEERVSNCIRRGAITCSAETSLIFVAQIMVVNRIRYCVVINDNHEVLGLISADMMIDAFDKGIDQMKAKEIVSRNAIVTVSPSMLLTEAVDLMVKKRVEHIVVIPDKPGSSAVIGLVFARDIVARMARSQEQDGRA